jgi:hypothetical protein
MQESIEQTEILIRDNTRECERKIQAEEMRQNEVHALLQQISKLQNDLKGSSKESGIYINRLTVLNAILILHHYR